MKKTYIAPEVEIVKIQVLVLLAMSDPDAITFEGVEEMEGLGGLDEGEYDPS